MSISVLFNTRERWLSAAKWFSFGALISSIVLLWNLATTTQTRLGEAYIGNQRIADANNVGVLFAVAVVVQMAIVWNFRNEGGASKWLRYVLIGWFLVIILLTASRGTLATIVAAALVFLFVGRLKRNMRILVAGGILSISAIGVYWSLNGPPAILSRFSADSVGTLGGRTNLWQGALDLMSHWSIPRTIVGEGTGSARYALGEHAPELGRMLGPLPFLGSETGIPRVSAHSSYFDWALSYGTIGILIGALLLVNAAFNCWRVDRGAPGAAGFAFLAIFVLTAGTTVIHAMGTDTIACTGIALGYIYMNHQRCHDQLSFVAEPSMCSYFPEERCLPAGARA